MISKNFTKILYITGAITMLPLLQFFLPATVLGQSGLQVGDAAGMAFAQHWGLVVFCIGALLVYAARHKEVRRPIVLAAGVEKLGIVVLVLLHYSDPLLQGLHTALFVDGFTVLLYAVYLLQGDGG